MLIGAVLVIATLSGKTVFNSSRAVYKSPEAPVHMMIGMAGAGHLGGNKYLPEPWSAFSAIEYGWVKATFANSSALKMEFVANGDGLAGPYAPSVKDSVWIVK